MGSDVWIGRVQEPERLKSDVCETADPADETVCRTALERDQGCGGKSGNGTSIGTSGGGKGGHDRPAGETSKQIVTRNVGSRQASGISTHRISRFTSGTCSGTILHTRMATILESRLSTQVLARWCSARQENLGNPRLLVGGPEETPSVVFGPV